MSKAALKEEIVRKLSADLASAERAQDATREAATHEEARPENDKDTRALEQSYLARGQARRVEELKTELALTRAMTVRDFSDADAIALGALVTVEEDGVARAFFLAPGGGGTVLSDGSRIVTPSSPLGRALIGKRSGDELEMEGGKAGVRSLAIVGVA